jgi:hypothetical protein
LVLKEFPENLELANSFERAAIEIWGFLDYFWIFITFPAAAEWQNFVFCYSIWLLKTLTETFLSPAEGTWVVMLIKVHMLMLPAFCKFTFCIN